MPLSCSLKVQYGRQFCVTDCPAHGSPGVFRYHRVERAEDVPPPDPLAVDVAVLDMNHGWPNLGHDSIVHAVMDAGCDLQDLLVRTGLYVRAISYDVRRGAVVPEAPGGRFALYLGTGGPGHLDPLRNDGTSEGSQGIKEDPSWERAVFRLFDAIMADESA